MYLPIAALVLSLCRLLCLFCRLLLIVVVVGLLFAVCWCCLLDAVYRCLAAVVGGLQCVVVRCSWLVASLSTFLFCQGVLFTVGVVRWCWLSHVVDSCVVVGCLWLFVVV